jgi:hypothetical protein
MSTPKADSTPVGNPTTTQVAVGSGSAAAAAKKSLASETQSKSILTSGAGVLEDPNLKKNILG